MILNNVHPVNGAKPIYVKINKGKIESVSLLPIESDCDNLYLNFENSLIFPGLINSHDHLDFNLFPQLGDKTYNNYTEWGKYIHQNYKTEIDKVLSIPAELRHQWGIYKNMLCGVTTVINHGEKTATANDLINVFEDTHCIHSPGFEKKWKAKLNNPLKKSKPVNIHVGEGIDEFAYNEIDNLTKWNLLSRKLVAIHGVAMKAEQVSKFEAIVWCPQSNYFLLNDTARIESLKTQTNILFGTDSTLTSDWNIWNHLKSARQTQKLNDEELFNALTINAAKTWRMNKGEIAEDKDADLIIAKKNSSTNSFDQFFDITPGDIQLIVQAGQIRLFDATLLAKLPSLNLSGFSKIRINGVSKYVQGDFPGLMAAIRRYHPDVKFPESLTLAA